ncbi:hypothetical protein FQN51_000755 [Onygenales sp. PD_10]|nr:hypothetical protein FQN51_000755 [Onygenales sp. PD_10]
MSQEMEKVATVKKSVEAQHVENTSTKEANSSEDALAQPETRMTKAKWLAAIALCISYTTAFQQNACTAAIVKHIDVELGPTTYYNWMLSGYSISVSVMYPLSGGLSDIFGRRWFFIIGTIASLIGTIVALAAQNVPTVIAGMVLKGIGAGSQQLALAAISEFVPNKQRGIVQAALDVVTFPWAIFGGLIGNAMVKYHELSFRINFIIGVILNIITMITIYFWYFPPSAPQVGNMTKMQRLAKLDWVGVFLMAVGIVLLLMGLAFGGTQFPWGAGGTIAPITIGAISLVCLGIWEWKFAKQPFFAHELFIGKARTFPLMLVVTFVAGMSLFTAMAFWTQQCHGMYTDDPIRIGISSLPGGLGGTVGGFFGAFLVGRAKFFKVHHLLICANTIKLIADAAFTTLTPETFPLALGMGFLAMFGMGMSLTALIVGVQLTCEDKDIGLATLVLGSVRAIGGSVAITIYTSILQNIIEKDAGPRVGKAVLPLGVPMESLPKFITFLVGNREDLAAQVEGVSAKALEVGSETIKWSWAEGFKNMYYVACAFTALGIICSCFIKDVTQNMTDNVAVTLTNDKRKVKELEEDP